MFTLVETYISTCKNYFYQYWKRTYQIVETLIVLLIGLFIFLQETGFEIMQTNLPTS